MMDDLPFSPRRGRPRKVLAEACPRQRPPVYPEVHRTHLKWAEEKYLVRKERELYFTNQHYEILREQRARANLGVLEPSLLQYQHIQAYRRMELVKRATAACDQLWPLSRTHWFYHLVLNVRSTECRLHHARRLQAVRLYMWRRLSKMVTGHVRSLHVDAHKFPHWDYVLAVPRHRQDEFVDALVQLNREIYGTGGPEDVRIWVKRVLPIQRHLERVIDYSLRARRFDSDPAHRWFEESFRADACGLKVGIRRRRWARCREYVAPEPTQAPISAKPSAVKQGRPRKSEGAAYRQRKRKKQSDVSAAGVVRQKDLRVPTNAISQAIDQQPLRVEVTPDAGREDILVLRNFRCTASWDKNN